jgi:predicted nucleic acid-binding protein
MMSNRGRLRADPGPGRFVTAAVIAAGRKPQGRAVDLMIAATAIAEGLPLYTTNPADFTRFGWGS